jgi:UDPglucose 6-dehydrogenase
MAARVIATAGGSVRGRTVGILGLTFKPETDDMREAPAIPIVGRLAEDGAAIRAFDPAGMESARPLLPESVVYCRDALDAARGADLLVVLTEWNEFRAIAPERLREAMRGNLIVDLRNLYEPAAMQAAGFRYHSIGRP